MATSDRVPAPPKREADKAAETADTLSAGPLPPDAINLNVEGRTLSGPAQGFGRLWRKRTRVRLDSVAITPEAVIKTWREHFGEFWPRGNRFFGPLTRLEEGDVAVINLEMPGGAKLSTGVSVVDADSRSFSLMTPEGHMYSGLITFSAFTEGEVTIAQAEIVMRASDPLFEVGMELFGHKRENQFWEETLEALAASFGVATTAQTRVECLDRRRQWSKAINIWQNSAIRTGIYQMTTPFRFLVNRARGRESNSGS